MKEKIGLILWLGSVIAGVTLLFNIFTIGNDSWKMALLVSVPFLFLSLATFPTLKYRLVRRIFFYVGFLCWVLLIVIVLAGMFPAGFVSHFITYSGACIILFTASAIMGKHRRVQK